jgi:hypothetical protein
VTLYVKATVNAAQSESTARTQFPDLYVALACRNLIQLDARRNGIERLSHSHRVSGYTVHNDQVVNVLKRP